VEGTGVKEEELALAQQIIAGLEGDFDPAELHSDYRARLRDLLEAKLEGHELAAPEPEPEAAPVVDLMEALRASVAAAQTEPAKKPAPRRKRAATGS
jgi:DNA end-binding protein Ku